jgi:putative effector of murein hydrolase
MVSLVNLSPAPVTLPVLIATIVVIIAIALIGTSIQRKYDFETRKLNLLLERIPPAGEMRPGSPSPLPA